MIQSPRRSSHEYWSESDRNDRLSAHYRELPQAPTDETPRPCVPPIWRIVGSSGGTALLKPAWGWVATATRPSHRTLIRSVRRGSSNRAVQGRRAAEVEQRSSPFRERGIAGAPGAIHAQPTPRAKRAPQGCVLCAHRWGTCQASNLRLRSGRPRLQPYHQIGTGADAAEEPPDPVGRYSSDGLARRAEREPAWNCDARKGPCVRCLGAKTRGRASTPRYPSTQPRRRSCTSSESEGKAEWRKHRLAPALPAPNSRATVLVQSPQ